LCRRGAARLRHLEEVGAQHGREARCARKIGHQDAVDEREAVQPFGSDRGHEHRNISMPRALILFELWQPRIVPIASVLASHRIEPPLRPRESMAMLMQVRSAHRRGHRAESV
jgi:hypothetical protein